MIHFFPFIKGQIELKQSKQEFADEVRRLTEKNLTTFEMQPFLGQKLKEYALDEYENYFNLWKIPNNSIDYDFIKTVIHCKIIEKSDSLYLKFYIRFNFFGIVISLLLFFVGCYLLYDALFTSNEFNLKSILLSLCAYPLIMWVFNGLANDDLDFIKKITS